MKKAMFPIHTLIFPVSLALILFGGLFFFYSSSYVQVVQFDDITEEIMLEYLLTSFLKTQVHLDNGKFTIAELFSVKGNEEIGTILHENAERIIGLCYSSESWKLEIIKDQEVDAALAFGDLSFGINEHYGIREGCSNRIHTAALIPDYYSTAPIQIKLTACTGVNKCI